MTTEHVSVPRDELEEIARELSKYEAREVAYYARHFGEELQAILSRATPSDDCACPQGQICKTMSCKRLQKPLNFPRMYEELRAAIDCGNESMTHEDALEWVRSASTPSAARVVTDEDVDFAKQAAYDIGDASAITDRAMRAALQSFATSLPAAVQDGEVRLWDTQWMSIVNHDNCYRDWSKDDAIAHAVKMTEQAIARNVADGKLPPKKTAAAPHAGERCE